MQGNQKPIQRVAAALNARGMPHIAACCAIFVFCAPAANGQQGAAQVPPHPIVIPNRTLTPDEMQNLADQNARKRNFAAANAARKQLIDDETGKLLILARDLQRKTEKMGSEAPTLLMWREADMIEFLANDVKKKMKLAFIPD